MPQVLGFRVGSLFGCWGRLLGLFDSSILWFGIIWYCCGFGFSGKRCGGNSLFGDFAVGGFGYFG